MSKHQKRNTLLLINPAFYRSYKETYSSNRYPLSPGYMPHTSILENLLNVQLFNQTDPNYDTQL